MSLKIYTITQDGLSNGNVISQPFKIHVHNMNYGNLGQLAVISCTENSSDKPCSNDDIRSTEYFDMPDMSSSKNNDLTNTFELLLEEKYPGKWSS